MNNPIGQKIREFLSGLTTRWDASIPDVKTAVGNIESNTGADSKFFLAKAYTGSIETGQKTVTATPAALFAGASELSGRVRMLVRNESADIRMRYGTAQSNLQENGFPIEPGEEKEFIFDANISQTIYGVSEGANITVFVEEK